MSTTALSEEQSKALQAEVQAELERREWAESNDSVMAEYVCVLLANGNARDKVEAEMADLVGSDFESSFLDWLFDRRNKIAAPEQPEPETAPELAPASTDSDAPAEPSAPGPSAGSRMFASAVEGTKRKFDNTGDEQNKRRAPDNAPTGPRGGPQGGPQPGRSLSDRLGPRGGGPGGLPPRGLNVRGAANGRGGHMNGPGFGPGPRHQQPGFRPPHGGFPGQGFAPGQQEMMMQMMAMQANMVAMAEQMANMQQNRPARPPAPRPQGRPTPAKVPAGTKLGGHAVSPIQPRGGALGPIPTKPTSTALCKFGVGCSNARCIYSHPSPVADEKTGMVLSEEACEAGKDCKDAECIKSHVSPAAANGGESAGPSRVLCRYQNCTNPKCQYRHEDANGNPIPPPALTNGGAATAADSAEAGGKASLDSALDDVKTARPCRFGERCTRADCKFSHPASRPVPGGAKPSKAAAPAQAGGIASGGMTASRKFAAPAAESTLNPGASEFKPAEPELQVSS
ncbi:mRNA-binding protein nab2 [Vanrija albida]|uniref:mRNA-binding protein nab2 n=1 Tax=Vanrija albida TaxID=181172 RepID=A0ABR3QAA7_9TREE